MELVQNVYYFPLVNCTSFDTTNQGRSDAFWGPGQNDKLYHK